MGIAGTVRRAFALRGRPRPGGTGGQGGSGRGAGAVSTSRPAIIDAGRQYGRGHQYNATTGEEPEIAMEQLVRRRQTDVKFRLAVQMYTAYSVGVGMAHAADEAEAQGRKALKAADKFCEEHDIDSLNQTVARDVWAAGNAFVAVDIGGRPKRTRSLRPIPLSSIVGILRNEDGEPLAYRQHSAMGDQNVDPGAVLHFAWAPEDGSAWGEGLGQVLARPGMGYTTANGKRSRRPPWFEIAEMTDDVAAKITYAGLPRYAVSAPGLHDSKVADVSRTFDGLEPLSHIVSNFETNIDTIALDTASRFDSFLQKLDNQLVAGVMSPLPRLWSSLNFTYASSKEALEATFPLIAMYQRAHSRFLERSVYAPVLMQAGIDPTKAMLRVTWGTREPLDMEALGKVMAMLSGPPLEGAVDPESILSLVQEAGVPIEPAKPEDAAAGAGAAGGAGAPMAKDLRDLRRIQDEARDGRVPISTLPPDDQYRALRLALLRKVVGQGGNGHAR